MSYFSILIAAIQTWQQDSTFVKGTWFYHFLQNLVGVETWFMNLAWWIFGIAVVGLIVVLILGALGRSPELFAGGGITCGCIAAFLFLLPLFEWITLNLARAMASAVDPTGAIIEPGKLIVFGLIYLAIGAG